MAVVVPSSPSSPSSSSSSSSSSSFFFPPPPHRPVVILHRLPIRLIGNESRTMSLPVTLLHNCSLLLTPGDQKAAEPSAHPPSPTSSLGSPPTPDSITDRLSFTHIQLPPHHHSPLRFVSPFLPFSLHRLSAANNSNAAVPVSFSVCMCLGFNLSSDHSVAASNHILVRNQTLAQSEERERSKRNKPSLQTKGPSLSIRQTASTQRGRASLFHRFITCHSPPSLNMPCTTFGRITRTSIRQVTDWLTVLPGGYVASSSFTCSSS